MGGPFLFRRKQKVTQILPGPRIAADNPLCAALHPTLKQNSVNPWMRHFAPFREWAPSRIADEELARDYPRKLLDGKHPVGAQMLNKVQDRSSKRKSIHRAGLVRANEQATRVALASTGVVVWEWVPGQAFITWGEGVERVYGLPADDLTFDRWMQIVHPDDLQRSLSMINCAIAEAAPYEGEFRVIWPDGSQHWVLVRGDAECDESGKTSVLFGMIMDITARRALDIQQQENRERLQAALSASRTGTFRWNIRTSALEWDEQLDRLFGLVPNERVQSLAEFIARVHPEDRDGVIQRCAACVELGHDFEMEYRVVWPDGSQHWLYDRGKTYYDADGIPLYMTGACVDITERKRAEEALLKQEKLAVVGRLASSIAHEINNPLEAITNLLYLAEQETGADAMREYVLQAQQQLSRAAHVTTHALRFHRHKSMPVAVSVSALLDSVIALFEGKLRDAGVTVDRRYRETSSIVASDNELRQVFANFVSNAIDAMSSLSRVANGGSLLVRARERRRAGEEPRMIVTIADSGMGMSRETRLRLFEPFYSTKEDNGAGLGLWISKEIMHRNGGRICLRSRQGVGTVFRLDLPFRSDGSHFDA